MKIGLLDIDYKPSSPSHYPNLALCKVSAYYKSIGADVQWATPFEYYDILYRSKVFNFSEDDMRVFHFGREERGGTGYDVTKVLPPEIDDMQPDLSIYPNVPRNVSYGYLSRGCPNKCAWCVVPKKEGYVKPYWDVERVANGNKKIILMDNNILALPDYAEEQFNKIIRNGYRIDFNQAMDARLVDEKFAKLIAKTKWMDRTIRFGCDTPKQIDECLRAIEMIDGYGFKGKYFLYAMLTNNKEETISRLTRLRDISMERQSKGMNIINPFSQPYRNPIKKEDSPQWQKYVAEWVNRKWQFYATDLMSFSPRKGIVMKDVFNAL